jgi:hypothetical protein
MASKGRAFPLKSAASTALRRDQAVRDLFLSLTSFDNLRLEVHEWRLELFEQAAAVYPKLDGRTVHRKVGLRNYGIAR